jgi:hypothetical protein
MEDAVADVAPERKGTPSITVAGGCILVGIGFLPDHDVTIRVAYANEDATDYLAFAADGAGEFLAALPTSSTAGPLHISATDHRVDPDTCGPVWSNTATIDGIGR